MGNDTPGCSGKACHAVAFQPIVRTPSSPQCSVRSDNLTETDEITGQIKGLFRRSRTSRMPRLESTWTLVARQLGRVEQLVANYSDLNRRVPLGSVSAKLV
jgi:hypothetical protein